MKKISLVTGANGHLGNNLVRELLKKGETVRAGVRNVNDRDLFEGLDCEVVYADLFDKDSLKKALKGVSTLYQVAAVFKHWSENPEKEIIEPNMIGTTNILEAAKEANVEKVVYVSSAFALELSERNTRNRVDETSWMKSNNDHAYALAKTKSEKLAWKLANDLNLNMVSVLPGSIVGGEYTKINTPSGGMFAAIVNGKMNLTFDTTISPIDANDVAKGMILAAEKGINGTRYILAPENPLSLDRIYEIARKVNPQIQEPKRMNKEELLTLAEKMELNAIETKIPPLLPVCTVKAFYGALRDYDMTITNRDLGFVHSNTDEVLERYFNKILIKA